MARSQTPRSLTEDHDDPELAHVRLVVRAGVAVTGRVLLAGKPLDYFGVTISKRAPGRVEGVRALDGRFTLHDLAPGSWQLALLGPSTRCKVLDNISVENGTVDLGDIAMEPGDRVAGRVRDARGAPVAKARVIVAQRWGMAHPGSRLEQRFLRYYETTTDSDGAYSIDGIDVQFDLASPLCVWATHDGRASVARVVSSGAATLDLVVVDSGGIKGLVQAALGHRLAFAARVDEPRCARSATIDDDGAFQFEELPPGAYRVSLLAQASSIDVMVDANEVSTVRVVALSPPPVTMTMSTLRTRD